MKTRDQIQKEALDAWIKSGEKGTVECITGLGKTKIALDAVKREKKTAKILFLAETTQREQDLREDQKKFRCRSWKIEFACYQSACKWRDTDWDLVIADEIHDSLTPVYSEFYWANNFKKIIGLSATVDAKAKVFRDDDSSMLTKGDYIKEIAPICYSYTIDDGQLDETSRPLTIYQIFHNLDSSTKNIVAGSKAKPFNTTELANYRYLDEQFRKAMFLPESKKKWALPLWARKRADLLYTLPSKNRACVKLLSALNTKSIVFANSIPALDQITPNVVSSKRSDKENTQLREDFNSGKIKTIGSFKMLKQGANLKDIDNCIIHSYYSKEKDLIQRIGRLRMNGKTGHVFIFVTNGTQEQKWYQNMLENINSFNIIPCLDVEDAIKKYRVQRSSEG